MKVVKVINFWFSDIQKSERMKCRNVGLDGPTSPRGHFSAFVGRWCSGSLLSFLNIIIFFTRAHAVFWILQNLYYVQVDKRALEDIYVFGLGQVCSWTLLKVTLLWTQQAGLCFHLVDIKHIANNEVPLSLLTCHNVEENTYTDKIFLLLTNWGAPHTLSDTIHNAPHLFISTGHAHVNDNEFIYSPSLIYFLEVLRYFFYLF